MRPGKNLFLVCTSVVVLSGVMLAFRRTAASLGTVELKGGSVKVEFVASAVGSGDASDITGVIKNSNAGTVQYGDITVTVTGKDFPPGSPPPTPVPPDLHGTKLSTAGQLDSVDNTPSSVPNGEQTHHATLPGGDLGVNGTLTLDINLDAVGNAGTIVVAITPSAANKPSGTTAHADVIESWEIEEGRPGATHVCSWTTHDRVVSQIINVDDRDSIVAIAGSVGFQTGSSLSLSSISLQDPDNSYASFGGASISVSGNSYSITGLNLGTSRRAELVAIFSGAPSVGESVALTVNATLD